MQPVSEKQLLYIMPRGGAAAVRAGFLRALNEALPRWFISTTSDCAAFLAQVAHESTELTHLRENLNYSADALVRLFGRHFWQYSDEDPVCPASKRPAHEYARQPQKIANWLYANRFGNGDEASGDGWAYRGGGALQITFKSNYEDASAAITGDGNTLLEQPDLITTPDYAMQAAGWYWKTRGLTELANRGGFEDITRKIRGDLEGQSQRLAYLNRAVTALTEMNDA